MCTLRFFADSYSAIWQFRSKIKSGSLYAELGQYRKAIQITRGAIGIDGTIGEQNIISGMGRLATYYASIGDTTKAYSILDSALDRHSIDDRKGLFYWQKGRLYAASKNQKEVRKLLDEFQKDSENNVESSFWKKLLQLELYRLQGEIEKAIMEYENLQYYFRSGNLVIKARLYEEAGDWEELISTTNEMQSIFVQRSGFRNSRHRDYPRAFYYRGIAYEEMGKPELAIENYEALLELWKDADEEIPERMDTIRRLAALKQES